MNNPFETIFKRLDYMESLLIDIKHKPEEKKNKRYPLTEAAEIANCSVQKLRIDIKSGKIKGEKFGGKYYIPHDELYNQFQEVKSLKYKR